MRFSYASLACCLVLAGLPAQSAKVTPFGKSDCCGTKTTSATLPKLGAQVVIDYTGQNSYFDAHGTIVSSRPALIVGATDKTWAGLTLPWRLPWELTLGNFPNDCHLYASLDLLLLAPFKDLWSFESRFAFTVPNHTSLLGVTVYAQCLTQIFTKKGAAMPGYTYWCTGDALALRIGT